MYLNAESVKVDSDEGSLTLEVFGYANTPDADEVTLTINIHGIDLDAFYDSVKAQIGPWLHERELARRTLPVASGEPLARSLERYYGAQHGTFTCAPEDMDESGGVEERVVAIREDGSYRVEPDENAYDPTDPKHPRFHSIHADIWDSREGK